MKKLINVSLLITLCTLLMSCNATAKTSAEERIPAINTKETVKSIEDQLKDTNLEEVRKKENLIMEKSIEDIQGSISKKELTYEELTAFYLDRILKYDKSEKGINSVIEINPKAMEIARNLDKENSTEKSPLYGIPVLIKDNINTKDMPTSGGTHALKDFVPKENAELVEKLLENKAIILGKTNLSELANFMSEKLPSGYSGKGGQTHNPFNPLNISPLGSSSGSGAGVAANFATVALGSETFGSIISPSYIHSLVGLKPTKGVISTNGVIPLASTTDSVGPMTKTVKDAGILFNGAISDPSKKIDTNFDKDYLKGKKIGLLKFESDNKELKENLEKIGATVVEVELKVKGVDEEYIILQDFNKDFKEYAEKFNAPVKSLEEMVEFNKKESEKRAKYGQDLIEDASKEKVEDREKIEKMVKDSKDAINKLMEENNLDAIAFVGAEGIAIPCVAGYPELTVPMGLTEAQEPKGATFVAKENEEEKLLNIGYSFEQNTNMRQIPKKYLEK